MIWSHGLPIARPCCVIGPRPVQRLGVVPFACYDVLELMAFTHPGASCVPHPTRIARHFGDYRNPTAPKMPPLVILDATTRLLRELAAREGDSRGGDSGGGDSRAAGIARNMMAGGWLWGPAVLDALWRGRPTTVPTSDHRRACGSGNDLRTGRTRPPETAPGQDSVLPNGGASALGPSAG